MGSHDGGGRSVGERRKGEDVVRMSGEGGSRSKGRSGQWRDGGRGREEERERKEADGVVN